MKNESRALKEIHDIRKMIYEETKNMSHEERAIHAHNEAQKLIRKYNLKVKYDNRILLRGKKMDWSKAKTIILKNQEVQSELKKNEAEYRIIEEIIMARREKNLTQKDLAALIGTKQSNISRLESGTYNPSLDFLNKIAHAVGKELEVRMV